MDKNSSPRSRPPPAELREEEKDPREEGGGPCPPPPRWVPWAEPRETNPRKPVDRCGTYGCTLPDRHPGLHAFGVAEGPRTHRRSVTLQGFDTTREQRRGCGVGEVWRQLEAGDRTAPELRGSGAGDKTAPEQQNRSGAAKPPRFSAAWRECEADAAAARRQEPRLKLKLKGATDCGEGEASGVGGSGGTAAHSRQAAAKRPRQCFEAGASLSQPGEPSRGEARPSLAATAAAAAAAAAALTVVLAEQLWAQCDTCSKWRRLPEHMRDSDELDEAWTCAMHPDPARRGCEVAEEELGADEVAVVDSTSTSTQP